MTIRSASDSTSEEHSELLTPRDVCARLKISRQTLSNWASVGRIHAVTLPSGHRRYRLADVDAITDGEVPA